MRDFLSSGFSSQTQPLVPREGLPFWSFWLLLCIILFLITFIFLRNKSLRQRLNLFFSRAKRKFVKIRLQSRLKKEKLRKEELLKELGKETWKEGISIEESKKIDKELKRLEESVSASQKELGEMDSKMEMVNDQIEKTSQKHKDQVKEKEAEAKPYREIMTETKEKEKLIELDLIQKQKDIEDSERSLVTAGKEAREIEENSKLSGEEKKTKKKESKEKRKNLEKKKEKIQKELGCLREERPVLEKEIKKLQRVINDCERAIKKIDKEKKEQIRKFQKEIKELGKNKAKVQKKIKEFETQKEPLFGTLGSIINENRVERKKLTLLYSQIDRVDKSIQQIERNIQNL